MAAYLVSSRRSKDLSEEGGISIEASVPLEFNLNVVGI